LVDDPNDASKKPMRARKPPAKKAAAPPLEQRPTDKPNAHPSASTTLTQDKPEPEGPSQAKSHWWKNEFSPAVILSLVSLILSLVTAGYALVGFYLGPVVEFQLPELVSFRCTRVAREDGPCLDTSSVHLVATSLAYLNTGQAGYPGTLMSERATVHIGAASFNLNWQYFSNITTSGGSAVNAIITPIPGASAIGHETDFYPRLLTCTDCDPRANYFPWRRFVDAIVDPAQSITIDFEVKVRTREEQIFKRSCMVAVSDLDRARFASEQMARTNVTSMTCVPMEGETNES
jgi:hypothetical protein